MKKTLWTPMDSFRWLTIAASFFTGTTAALIILRLIWPNIIFNELIITFATITGAMWGGVTTVLSRIGVSKINNKREKE